MEASTVPGIRFVRGHLTAVLVAKVAKLEVQSTPGAECVAGARRCPSEVGFSGAGRLRAKVVLPTWRGPATNTILRSRSDRTCAARYLGV